MDALPRTAEAGLFVASPSTKDMVVRHNGGTTVGPDWHPGTARFDNVAVAPAGLPGAWRDDDVGGPVQQVDGAVLPGVATRSGGRSR